MKLKYLYGAALLIQLCHAALAGETLWIEAEHLDGVRGYCWPMGQPQMKKTDGHWALSGPGWAAEWNQGGESGFLSIATGADDDRAVATKTVEIPEPGTYFVWVRYGDWREKTERFDLRIDQQNSSAKVAWSSTFGERPLVEEDNEMKLYFGWAFAWDKREVRLDKGPARLSLASTAKEQQPRQVDVIVLTTDAAYRPRIKERPRNESWDLLDSFRKKIPSDSASLPPARDFSELPAAWKLRTFRDKGFIYLWNVSHTDAVKTWLSDRPDRVKVPYNVLDERVRKEFETKYAGRDDVPIYSDPRIVPTFHGVGPGVFATEGANGEVLEVGRQFARWLDQHPDRAWATMMNYHGGAPVGPKGRELLAKYRDRFVGSIAGESLGYFDVDGSAMKAATAGATTRRQLVEAFAPLSLKANAAKYNRIYGGDVDANPYADVISCLSVGNIAFVPLCAQWGARTIGYESSAATSVVLPMRWAFMRGAARQHGNLTATYRSCNFGDASTLFADGATFASHKHIFDNYYSVYSGAGMTWYKMDIWYQYMAGSSMFYHEQGHDEFWKPGGTSAAGEHEVALSPKGQLVDRFLRLTAAEPDRGHPVTPVAFLVDYAHGWEPAPFWPNSFNNWHANPDRFHYGDHERMLEEYFWTAYYPIGPVSQRPITSTSETFVPGVFGDIFDVVCAYPDVKLWRTIDTYPLVIAAGDIELTAAEGARLAKYMENGGTLLVADSQLSGPGVAALKLPPTGDAAEATQYRWAGDDGVYSSPRFRYKPIVLPPGVMQNSASATTPDGKLICTMLPRGRGRLVYLSIPRGLSITKQAVPIVPRLFAGLTRGLMPIEVSGEVEWLVNRTQSGWAVTLLNPAGQDKPQQGITPTDYRQNKLATIKSAVPIHTARDRLNPLAQLSVQNNTVICEVPAGGVCIIEVR